MNTTTIFNSRSLSRAFSILILAAAAHWTIGATAHGQILGPNLTGGIFGDLSISEPTRGGPLNHPFSVNGAGPSPAGQLLNISTRLRVLTGENILIGGFIVTGTQPKKIIVRGIGPSLSIGGALSDPILELRDSSGGLVLSNDNWRTGGQEAEIIATTIPPSNDLESAIVATLPANGSAYTAIVRGANNGTGIGLVEAYDLDQTVNSKLANISTRGFVDTGDNAMIGGFILGGASGETKILIRGVGFSLSQSGVGNPLDDPTLELHDGNGTQIASNDNWRETDGGLIQATGIPPSDFFESSIVALFFPGNYTAIVRGKSNTTGVALVEVYDLGSAPLVAAPKVQTVSGLGTSFEVIAAGAALTYQWQRLPLGGGSWANIVNGSAYSGATTSKLTLSEMTTASSGDQFRVVVTNPSGAVTSGSETFVAHSLLKDATSFAATYPPLGTVTFPTKAGDILTVTAYPGFVQLVVDPGTPEATVTNTVSANGGGVVAKTPLLGLYLVQLAPGNEFAFLNALYANSFVIDGTPASPAAPAGCMVAVDFFSRDPGGDPDPCYQFHGPIVENILKRSGGCVVEFDVTTASGSTKDADPYVVSQGILRKIERANASGDLVVINVSLQSLESAEAESIDRTGCSNKYCRAIRHEQIQFYYKILRAIESAALTRPDHAVNAIVVMTAGNAGIDQDLELVALQNRFPNAFKTVRIVGGVDPDGEIIADFNHYTDNSSNVIAYARGDQVQEGVNQCSGTSFAGPEVARVLDYIRSHSPGATATQILSAFDQALNEVSAQNILPQNTNGLTTQAFLDRAVALAASGSVIRFDGSYTGGYSGTASYDDGSSGPVSGSVAFTVANGAINVTDPGSGSGTVSSTGVAAFSGSGATGGVSYSFNGIFVVSETGAASAGGGWSATFIGGTASGGWSAGRP